MKPTLCDRIRDARKGADKRQKEIAQILGITQQQYSLYETGRRPWSADYLRTICQALGVSADYLLGLPPTLSSRPQ